MKLKLVSSGKGIHSPEFYRKKKKKKLAMRIFAASGAMLLLASAIFFLRSDMLRISQVSVSGSDIRRDVLVAEAGRVLGENYLWFIPKSNAFFYPREVIQQNLVTGFPEFKSIDVGLEGLDSLVITVEEREPFALYCKEDECYLMDNEGFIFSHAPSFSEGVYLPYRLSENLNEPLGSQYLPSDEFAELSLFVGSVQSLGLEPASVSVSENDYMLSIDSGAKILWQRSADPGLVRANLEAFLSSPAVREDGGFVGKLETLDLRTENKVFYRFRK